MDRKGVSTDGVALLSSVAYFMNKLTGKKDRDNTQDVSSPKVSVYSSLASQKYALGVDRMSTPNGGITNDNNVAVGESISTSSRKEYPSSADLQVLVYPTVVTPTVCTPIVEKTNDGFQTMGKKKKNKGKTKYNNSGQFGGYLVKQTVIYELEAITSVTVVSNKEGNITMSNSFAALDDESKEDVENVYDESPNLLHGTQTGESSSTFMVAAGTDIANITRQRPKPDKNRHKNGKSTQEPGIIKKSQPWSTLVNSHHDKNL
uniref:Uncharacterized protein n=1 Tax=Tanacetum cinerariifolium TaxID=118510 RepID=A0A699HXS9_TANCI|nr:hypothetical protein [Tanacetum cinerariifolium]